MMVRIGIRFLRSWLSKGQADILELTSPRNRKSSAAGYS